MGIAAYIDRIASIGVKKEHALWEMHLIRKINLSSLLGIVSVLTGVAIFVWIGQQFVWKEVLLCLSFAPFIFYANYRFGYVVASYLFSFMGFSIFFFLCVRTGVESLSFLYYFPLIIGMTQMFGRREMIWHLMAQLIICCLSIILEFYCYKKQVFVMEDLNNELFLIRAVNIAFSFITTIAFVLIITFESIRQETQLKAALNQKEVLLAELFHRVKNNMNLITSLLNLKKDKIRSVDGRQAIEECRDLVYAMALVHTKVYNTGDVDRIRFDEYVNELVKDLVRTLDEKGTTELKINSEMAVLNVSQAIPCGLILNELVTNSFKHARMKEQKLILEVELAGGKDNLMLRYKDNGPGVKEEDKKKNTLGLELISSLADQLDGKMSIGSGPGFRFELSFAGKEE